MYTVYFDFKLRKKINITTLGITIRNTSKKEKDLIFKNVNKIISKKEQILSFYEKNNNLDENSLLFIDKISQISDNETRELIMASFGLLKAKWVFNDIDNIKKIINQLVIIEVDSLKLKEHGIIDEKKFISNILLLNNVCESPLFDKKITSHKDYTFILEDNPLDQSDKYYFHGLMISFVFKYSEVDYKSFREVATTNGFLMKLEDFLNKLDINNIYKFINIIDLLFSDYSMIQNAIISNVTIIESLIIREKEDIEKAFILKGGLILKKYLTKSSNDAVKSLLQFTYNIRSDIVHGNYDKVLNDLNKLNQTTKETKKLLSEVSTTINKRNDAYTIALTISTLLSRATTKYWIENPTETEYMKKN